MKFTLSWLKDWLETDADPAAIAETLTNIGLEVENLSNPAVALAPFRIAKVLTAEKHPQADKLQVLTVDDGSGGPIQVVCGAPNARAGLVGAVALPGTDLRGLVVAERKVRGVLSRGMLCSERELGLSEDHGGILLLDGETPIGRPLGDVLGARAAVVTCADHDQDGCLEWGPPSPCAAGCLLGACVDDCRNECPAAGITRCDGSSVETCAAGSDGCLHWNAPIACPPGTTCSLGLCATTCADECELGTKSCEAGGVVQCDQIDADPCAGEEETPGELERAVLQDHLRLEAAVAEPEPPARSVAPRSRCRFTPLFK